MNKKLIIASALTLLALPVLTFAVSTVGVPTVNAGLNINTLIDLIFGFIWPIIGIVVVFFFIMAGFQFMTSGGDPAKVEVARQSVIWAIAGVVVLLLSFTIPFIVKNTLGV